MYVQSIARVASLGPEEPLKLFGGDRPDEFTLVP